VRLVMAVGAKGDTVLDIIVAGNNVVHLNAMQPAANTTTPTAFGKQLLYFYFIKAHGTFSFLHPLNDTPQPPCLQGRLQALVGDYLNNKCQASLNLLFFTFLYPIQVTSGLPDHFDNNCFTCCEGMTKMSGCSFNAVNLFR
jgi:hypothetical protein